MPTLTGFAPSITFAENTVNSTPQLLDADVDFTDVEGDFDGGGVLTLSGLLAEDTVSVRNQGTAAGQIGLSGANVTWGGVIIGTLSGGVGATLTITFNASATSEAIDALIQNLTYANTSNAPTASRDLALNVTDAAGNDLGPAGAPSFVRRDGAANPFDGVDVGNMSTTTFADLDGDGDMDAVIGSGGGTIAYFENTGTAEAPVFTQQSGAANPFDGVNVGYRSTPTFADLDGDGDMDAVVGQYFSTTFYFENTGTTASPEFTLRTGAANPFDSLNLGPGNRYAFADLDGDGDLDALMGSQSGSLTYFENTGTASVAEFTQRTGGSNPFNGVNVGAVTNPVFGDVDGDGDIDAVIGANDGRLHYFENTGTTSAPIFTQQTGSGNPFDGFDIGDWSIPSLADLDGDGDLDVVVGEAAGTLRYLENTSVRGQVSTVTITAENDAPAAAGVPSDVTVIEDIASNLDLSAIALTDVDTAGSITVVLTASAGTLTSASGGGVTVTDSGTGAITLSGTAAAIDAFLNTSSNILYTGALNQSGDDAATLTITANDGSGAVTLGTINIDITPVIDPPVLTGFATSATFAENTVNTTPQLLDADVDFTDDGNDYNGGTLTLSGLLAEDTVSVRNQGSAAGQIGLSGASVSYGGVIIGTLAGGAGGTLTITFNASATSEAIDALIQNLTYANSSDTPTASRDLLLNITDAAGSDLSEPTAFTRRTGPADPFDGVGFVNGSHPVFADLDGDGDLDAVVGTGSGPARYFENTGAAAALFVERTGGANPLNGLSLGFYEAWTFADLDDDGDLDAVIGVQDGTLNYLENTGTALTPAFTQRTGAANPFNGATVGSLAAPTFADLDGDGDLDAVVGGYFSGVNYFENTGSASTPVFTQRIGAANPFDGFVLNVFSKPSLADLDGDGDLDLVVGQFTGQVLYFENTGSALAPGFTERTGGDNPLNGIDVGYWSAPTFADLDGDGDLDTVVGGYFANLTYVENTTVRGAVITVNVTAEDDGPVITGTGGSEGLNGTSDAETILGLDGDDRLNGLGGDDVLDGGAGNDTLRGGTGDDEMRGGAGDDIYQVDSQGDLVIENINEGNDRILSTVSYVLAAGSEVERMSLADANAVTTLGLTGNEFGQRIDGDNGANTLDGGGGNDLLLGNQGDDTLYGRTGTDDIRGGAGADTLNGDEDNDILNGGSGNDQLIGGTGDDAMTGGTGNDTYYVDSQADTVNELDGEGDDRVIASVNYVLAAGVSVEHMSTDNLAGVTAINLTGNDLAQEMDGNAGANILSGLGGDDEVNGQGGNDQLFGGLGDDDLTGGDGDDTLYGEDDGDTLSGGDGNDALVGGLGDDSMTGGLGDDAYYVDSQDDTIDELDGQGNDRVVASASYVLAAGQSIERIQIANTGGTAAIDITGNEFGQRIDGNDGANILDGGGGSDVINARAGNDTVHGGLGNDELRGNDGNDRLFGGADVDNLLGGSGNDEMDGGTGGDRMVGDIGNDTYHVDSAGDTIVEFSGEGNDRVFTSVDFNVGSVSIERLSAADQAGVDPLRLYGGADTVQIDGNAGDNLLSGALGGRSVTLNGRGGQDTLFGSAFNDILSGGTGDDYVTGGEGNDFIHGGSGIDVVAVSGTVDDYVIEQLDDDSYSIDGRDGSDTTFGVEYIYFERSGEWYLLSDIEGGPVDPPFGPPAFPDSGSGKSRDDAQILPGLADEASDLRSLPDLFDMTGPDMRTADDGLGLDPTSSGRSHDDGWLF